MHELVFKPTGESGGKGVFIGPSTDSVTLAGLADVIRRSPEKWIAQELVRLSTVPTADADGVLAPRHVDLRPFAVFGETISIVPGGLSRVAMVEGSMIVNSSRGGGSKDTWILENGEDRSDRAAPMRPESLPPALPDLRYGAWTGQRSQQQQQPARCSPASHRSCSGSGATSPAPSRPRACSTASSRPSCRAAPRTPARRAWAGTRSCTSWAARATATCPRRRDAVLDALTRDADNPASVVACVARAREGAQAVRDVISAEMWEAINTTHLRLRDGDLAAPLAPGHYSIYKHVKERSALFWGLTGRTMLRDEASAFLAAGGRIESADMVLRMLRVALPAGDAGESADGQAIALLQAVGGFQAYRRAVPAPAHAKPVARFLLFERNYPDSVAAAVDVAQPRAADRRRVAAQLRADPAPQPAVGRPRVPPQRRERRRPARHLPGGPARARARRRGHRPAILRRRTGGLGPAATSTMHFAIRFLTEYVYDAPVSDNLNALRVRPATTSTQRCDEFTVRIDPEARVGRHSDYFGTEVLEFGIVRPHKRLSIDVRARVVTAEPPEPPDVDWAALDTEAYAEAAGEYLLPAIDESDSETLDELVAAVRADDAAGHAAAPVCDLIPDRYEYRAGVTYVGSTVQEFLETGAGVCQDYVHLGLIMLRRNGIAARYVSGYLWAAPEDEGADSVEVETHAWLEALLPGAGGRGEPQAGDVGQASRAVAGSRSGSAPTRRTASSRASAT